MNTQQNSSSPDIQDDTGVEAPSGYTDLSGPAAFKAKQAADLSPPASDNPENVDSSPADMGPVLLEKLKTLEQALAQSNDQILRAAADMDNLRKRSQREREDAAKFAISSFAKELLDVADNFRRALDAIPQDLKNDEKILPLVEGIEATERTLLKAFEKNGIKKVEPLDQAFDPNFHEVMFETPVTGKVPGTVIQIIEVGYTLNDRLLRPARVGVAKGDVIHHIDTQA